ncbi:Cardiomyopathy-associated protein 5 [Microtus ochrogaster]|uniref:Cardiomyopathy-associated protein 5 n=1 Tax=Microtus ochrogaster TaxID=79684 RepID=A0A8J6L2S6_MICOH|nr:Cardiomyopathy-associated protein 5 [Microtus ochrogaster]
MFPEFEPDSQGTESSENDASPFSGPADDVKEEGMVSAGHFMSRDSEESLETGPPRLVPSILERLEPEKEELKLNSVEKMEPDFEHLTSSEPTAREEHVPEPIAHIEKEHAPEPIAHREEERAPESIAHIEEEHAPEPMAHREEEHALEPIAQEEEHAPEPMAHREEEHALEPIAQEEEHAPEPIAQEEEHAPEPSVAELERQELEKAVEITDTTEPEDSSLEEEIIELDYPESPLVSEGSFSSPLSPEVEHREEPILPSQMTFTPEHVSLSEEEREESESLSTDSAFVSEYSVPQDLNRVPEKQEAEAVSLSDVKSLSEPAVFSEEDDERESYSPAVASESELSLSASTIEKTSASQSPLFPPVTPDHLVLSGDEASESRWQTPETAPATENSGPVRAAQE